MKNIIHFTKLFSTIKDILNTSSLKLAYCSVANALARLLRARQNKEDSHLPDQLRLPIMTIKCFTKNAKGYNSCLDKHNFDFRSENEWRYVPTKKRIAGSLISQHKSHYSKSLKSKTYYNEKLKPHWLKFSYSDIEKIFVTSQEESNEICDEFRINKNKIQIGNWKSN